MLFFLLLLVLSLAIFGGGFFCGFLTFRKEPSISITLPANSLSEPMEALQDVLQRFDKQLAQHGQCMQRGIADLNATGDRKLAGDVVLKLVAASQAFEQQVNAFASDVRQVEEQIATVKAGPDRPRETSAHKDAGGTPPATTPRAAPVEKPPEERLENNRRTEMRHPFFYKQWVAPYGGVRAPEVEEFFLVQCRDISSSGISFFLDRVPSYELVVVRLAGPDEPRYLTARIQRTTPSGNLEYGRYVIGCRFLGSLNRSGLPPTLDESIRRREQRHEPEPLAAR